MNPLKYAQMMKYLTRAKKANPDLPDVFPASKAPIPSKTQNVEEIEAINAFIRRERQQKAGGGMLVQPSADGSRPGYRSEKTFNKRQSGIYTSRNKSTKEYTGQPFVRDSTKNKPLPPNAVRSGESVIFLGKNAQANADKFLELTRAKGGDLNELKRLIDEANKGFKFVKIKDLQEAAGFSRQTSFNPKDGIYGSLDTLEIKLQKAFDYVMGDPNKPVVDMFDPMSQVKKLVGTSDAPGRYLKGYEPYESNKRIIKVLAAPKSKAKLRKAENLTLGNLEFRIDNNVKGDVLFAPPKQVSPETKIMDIVDRHIKQGGTKIEWVVKPEITKGGYPSYGDAVFKYKGKEYDIGRLINEAKDDPNFKEFFKAQREYKTLNDKIVTHPKTGKKIRFGNLMKEVYGDSVVPYNVDHYKSILDEPFTSLRVLPRRINIAAGNIKSFNEMDITKPELAGKYSDAGKEMQLKKIGYNFNQPIEDLIQAELKLADDVLNKGRVLRKPNEIIESIRKGENYKPDFYSKTAKPGKGFETLLQKIGCPGLASGGRAGFDVGTNCQIKGANLINSGMRNASSAQLKNFTAFANRAASLGRGVMKFGVIPEALFVAADSVIRIGMGDNFNEAFLRASDYLRPGDQAKQAEMLEADRFFGPEVAGIIGKSLDYKNELAKVQSLEDQKTNLENLSGGGVFDYVGDTSQDVKNIDVRLKQATDNLNNKFKMTDAERIYAERMQDEVDDARSSGSFFTKLKSKFRDVGQDQSDIETLGMPEQTQEDLNKKILPAFGDSKDFITMSTADAINLAKAYRAQGSNVSAKDIIAYRDSLRNSSLSDLAQQFNPESVYGASGTMGEPINKPVFKKPQNVIGDMEKEIVGQTNVANPFDLDISDIGSGLRGFAAAGGGIAKSAGIDQGPPPVSGPNPQGLLSLKNRVRNY